MFEKNKLSICVAAVLGLCASMPLYAEEAGEDRQEETADRNPETKDQTPEQTPEQTTGVVARASERDSTIENIVVTGSLIPRTSFDGPDPMTVIDEEDMKKRGLLTVADVVDSLSQNTGYREGKSGNLLSGFTVGASEVNLRGLGTGRTLVLVNGRRIADYPMPFGGEQNGTDVATIPGAALARTEVLSGSASAIYGSDAVGGVVNMITKRDMEQTSISHVTGAFEDGNGLTNITSFVTGTAFDRGSVTFSLEKYSAAPISADEVSFLDDRRFLVNGISVIREDMNNPGSGGLVSPAGYDCAANGMVAAGSSEDGRLGCNFDASRGIAMASEVDRTSIFVDGRYQITDTINGFATVLGSKQDVASSVAANFWRGAVYNADFSEVASITRSFAHDLGYSESSMDQEMWTLMLGLEGEIDLGGSSWNWDVGYSRARFQMTQKNAAMREDVLRDWLFEGAGNFEILAPDLYQVSDEFFANGLVDNIYRNASADRDALLGHAVTFADSGAQSLTGKVVGEIGDFGVFYNPVTMAIAVEWSSQDTGIDPDERSLNRNGNGWLNLGAVEASGSRDRKAIGAEFQIPVFEDLELTLASRFDRYDDSTAIGGRNTSSAKFVYSPFDLLKFRGHIAQTFRAPDMFNIYGESTGYSDVIDLLGGDCFDGEQITGSCPAYTVTSIRSGSTELEEEKGKDIGFGVVFTPADNVNISADWYRVRLDDLVLTESAYELMSYEWQCATGGLPSGSQFCQSVQERVQRDATGQVDSIIIQPQNQQFLEVEGLDLRASANFESAQYGNFYVGAEYTNTLSHEFQQFAGDQVFDIRTGFPGQSVPATRSNLHLYWSNPLTGFKSVGTGLTIQRQGRVDNYALSKALEPHYTVNLSGNYQVGPRLNLGLNIQNLTNAMPTTDATNPLWPYYWSHLQSPLGRAVSFSVNYYLSD
ncbi:TonB-dependent receptor domain-containing protein [Microbulbifer magnicolonia]|uniref:TonB-dependent receptor domain-containing protein n=1 Tax=Microbulbifer magnicolonia TaxID=3109744 RepID=UPI002B414CE4|nr:TonB-dependent receptor [Microbulbifer sp. GG15]